MTNNKNVHLIVSAIVITIISLAYGISPQNLALLYSDFTVVSVDLKQVFRATMGLYLAMVMLWVNGVTNPYLWRTATISNIFFMIGLAAGRIISLLVDGIPSFSFLIGIVLELALALWGIKNLYKYEVKLEK